MKDYSALMDFCDKMLLARKVNYSDREEIIQEAMYRLTTTDTKVKNPRAYLFSICVNLIRKEHRRRGIFYRGAGPVYFGQPRARTPLEEAISNETPGAELLEEVLTEGQRQVFEARVDGGGGQTSGGERALLMRARRVLRSDKRVLALR